MPTGILDAARDFLFTSLKGQINEPETRHPWRKGWEFAVMHSLRVEQYVLQILARDEHLLSGHQIELLQLAAILHDLSRLKRRSDHAETGARVARDWLQSRPGDQRLADGDIDQVVDMIAVHSDKQGSEPDPCKAILKDADILDEVGIMSIFMTTSWLDRGSPFFFHDLRQRLIEFELPFCDRQMAILHTQGAGAILREKKLFIEGFIEQLSKELQLEDRIQQALLDRAGRRSE